MFLPDFSFSRRTKLNWQKYKHDLPKRIACAVLIVILYVFYRSLWWSEEGPCTDCFPEKTSATEKKEAQIVLPENDELIDVLQAFKESLVLGSKLCIIDPTTLYHMIAMKDQLDIARKGFELGSYSSPNRVFSLAIFTQELLFRGINSKLLSKQFQHWKTRIKIPAWYNRVIPSSGQLATHHFYVFGDHVLHILVFIDRGDYLWHSNLPPGYLSLISKKGKGIVYGKESGSFEKFGIVPSRGKWGGFHVPEDIKSFLHQLSSSKHLECSVRGPNNNNYNNLTLNSERYPPMPLFNRTTVSAIKEMKRLTKPLLMNFWLASGTLLGWRRDCGIIPYTHDVDFAAWSGDISDYFIRRIGNYSEFKVLAVLGKPVEDLELWLRYRWLRVDLFFVYKDDEKNHLWVGGHRPEQGYSFRYIFPNFKLCSTDFLGQRVLVPCTPDDVISAEYGPDWRTPTSDWNYELSARNVLGRRYWDDTELERFPNV